MSARPVLLWLSLPFARRHPLADPWHLRCPANAQSRAQAAMRSPNPGPLRRNERDVGDPVILYTLSSREPYLKCDKFSTWATSAQPLRASRLLPARCVLTGARHGWGGAPIAQEQMDGPGPPVRRSAHATKSAGRIFPSITDHSCDWASRRTTVLLYERFGWRRFWARAPQGGGYPAFPDDVSTSSTGHPTPRKTNITSPRLPVDDLAARYGSASSSAPTFGPRARTHRATVRLAVYDAGSPRQDFLATP
ncbi:hypothetical protein WOLCODRAFT_145437 [Wolfiporia cocos MD-104 SS10]|uniref:Uncharacterized protein n=1 Tax=Wolfiporia cocos (strain MD-104) TaxID=742152 RepID=A0A2H3IXG8_WOLCO|nr:hypothetical protein WOLCODRAFT_145437 [Wolfiporia cocos MD-104 SS10]